MVHFGLFCPPGSGHLNPIATLGHQLQHRGHRVTLINIMDAQTVADTAGIEFYPIGQAEFPPGSAAQTQEKLDQLDGLIGLKYTMDLVQSGAAVVLREAPAVIQQLQIEALIVDQVSLEAGSIAEALRLPFISVCNPLLRSTIEKVLNQPRYREQAQRLQQAIAQSGGVNRAADIVEQAVSSVHSSQQ